MIRNATLTIAAALLAASAFTATARAETTIHDANTGLDFRYFTGTLADLQAQGAPISGSAQAYLKQHGGARSATSKRGNVYLLEQRPVYGYDRAYVPDFNDRNRPW